MCACLCGWWCEWAVGGVCGLYKLCVRTYVHMYIHDYIPTGHVHIFGLSVCREKALAATGGNDVQGAADW